MLDRRTSAGFVLLLLGVELDLSDSFPEEFLESLRIVTTGRACTLRSFLRVFLVARDPRFQSLPPGSDELDGSLRRFRGRRWTLLFEHLFLHFFDDHFFAHFTALFEACQGMCGVFYSLIGVAGV